MTGLPVDPMEEKDALREALDVVANLTIREIAAQLGVSVSLLYACTDPVRNHRLGPTRLRELSAIYCGAAEQLQQAALQLTALADRKDTSLR